MHPENGRIDPGTEVVDVRDHHGSNAAIPQPLERARTRERVEEVAVAGTVERHPTVVLAEQRSARLETKRDVLREDRRLRQILRRDELADDRIRREARHQSGRDLRLERRGDGRRLPELQLEKAAPVEHLDRSLDDAAEPGRHPARQHDGRDLPSSQSREAHLPLPLVLPALGQHDDVARSRWLDCAL